MGMAADRLTQLVDREDRYDIPFDDLRAAQVDAMNERFQEREDAIKLLRHRADEAGLHEIRSHEDMVHVLFPHTAYKSYPESLLTDKRWDRIGKWLDTISSHRVPPLDASQIGDVDDLVETLKDSGHYVSCSSGTTGKCAMLVASAADLSWCRKEAIAAFSWGSGIKPAQDRRLIGTGPFAQVPRNLNSVAAFRDALQDPETTPFVFPVPPITISSIVDMVVLRRAIASGTATPAEIQKFEQISAVRQKAIDEAVTLTAQAVVEARSAKLHFRGLWSAQYAVAKTVRDMGYGAGDFNPENSIAVAGGLKRAILPEDYREFIYETFNIQPKHIYLNYAMQELHSSMPRCQEGGRYHLPPWLVPLILNKDGDALLPITAGEYEGRGAFFDLSLDGRWGGVISGDRVSIDFSPCACGSRGPSIRDDIVRYADIEGDDKINCAGTVDAYVRGVA